MKVCSKCKLKKKDAGFSRRSDAPHRLVSQCKTCRLKWLREYRQQNPKAIERSRKKWVAKNPEKAAESPRKYREKHREVCRERVRKWTEKNRDKARKAVQKWAAKNSERIENKRLIKKYGITSKEWDTLFAEQAGACAICRTLGKELKKKLAVDHDHSTGKVRGLLCGSCNIALGSFKDSTSVIEAALLYLSRTKNFLVEVNQQHKQNKTNQQ